MARPKSKEEFRKDLAEQFLTLLDEKGLTWTKEWVGKGGQAPHNAITGVNYRGVNSFQLQMTALIRKYEDPRWATMLQIMDNDKKYHPKEKWHLKSGTKATYVEYWFPYDLSAKKGLSWDEHKKLIANGRDPKEFTLRSKYTAVFNASQIEGIKPLLTPDKSNIEVDDLVPMLSKNMQVPIHYDGGDRAYYSPSKDEIHLPTPESFSTEYDFNATALHELAHSTGHASRLNRDLNNSFGSESYAYEELVAEMTSCFMGVNLNAESNISHIKNHKAYVQSWAKAIKENENVLVKAIKDAQAATDYMESKVGLITSQELEKRTSKVLEVEVQADLQANQAYLPPQKTIGERFLSILREFSEKDYQEAVSEFSSEEEAAANITESMQRPNGADGLIYTLQGIVVNTTVEHPDDVNHLCDRGIELINELRVIQQEQSFSPDLTM